MQRIGIPLALVAVAVFASACADRTVPPTAVQLKASVASESESQSGDEILDHAVIHHTVEGMAALRRAPRGSGLASAVSNLSFRGGSGGIGVETAPKVYLVVWGSQWNNNDPSGEVAILQSFLSGVGGSGWLASVTQYCQGVAAGTVTCAAGSVFAGNQPGILAGVWYDNARSAPSRPRQSDIAREAVAAAQHFGNTTAASNASVQYVIATATRSNASGFGTQYCAYHSSTSGTVGSVAYTNLPYITDAGASCGANFNGLGAKAGITIVEGHELGETITDQFPSSGWLDAVGYENGDKCAWLGVGSVGAAANVTIATGAFPLQSLWSNAMNAGAGGCALNYP